MDIKAAYGLYARDRPRIPMRPGVAARLEAVDCSNPWHPKARAVDENIGAAAAELTSNALNEIESGASNTMVEGSLYPEYLERMIYRRGT